MRRPYLWLSSSAVIVVGGVCQWRIGFNNDNAWLLYMAKRVLEGARLYQDLIEINPPLIVWLNLPVAWIARTLEIESFAVFRIAVLVLCLGCCWACRRIAKAALPSVRPDAVFLVCAVVLFVLPVSWFGQREHLLLALVLPYLWLSAGRLGNRAWEPGRTFTAAAGVLAAIGIALKPQFLGIWLGVLLVALSRNWPALRWPENRTFVLAGAAYLLIVLLATPEYFTMIGLLGPVYAQYRPESWLRVLFGHPEAIVALVALLAYMCYRGFVPQRTITDVLATATAAGLVGAVLQGKGFDYHYYPSLALALLLIGMMAVCTGRGSSTARRAHLASAALFVLGLVPYAQAAMRIASGPEHAELQAYRDLADQVGPVEARSLLVLAPRSGFAFGLVTYGKARWVGRFPCLWAPPVLRGAGMASGVGSADTTAAERWVRETVIADALRARPDLILVGVPTPGVGPEDYWFDFLAYFGADSRFAELMAGYESDGQAVGYYVFRRVPEFRADVHTEG